ncbi:MAG: radical SAM protein [Kiritimatiellaeota bacterium]|nr:radical SAM protein [Kiritimatiellota bacterium]
MDPIDKLRLLSEDSQYDLACSCGTSEKDRRKRGLDGKWLYPVPMAAGGYGIMFKTLMSNACSSDCRYCPLRQKGNIHRCALSPDETASLFMSHLQRQWLLGMFLSSGILDTADRTMERLVASAEILRRKHRYRGYIHLKVIPGASDAAIDAAMRVASAVSLNIEVPGRKHAQKLSSRKDFDTDIVRPLKYIAAQTAKGSRYARIRTTTQFIVGASDEADREIITYLDGIYNRLNFRRAYFSAYQRGLGEEGIPGERFILASEADQRQDASDRLTREHRLYQADFLLRKYRFNATELVFDDKGNFDLSEDPKLAWAKRHPEQFPVNLATASKETLLRVPGLGPTYVERILCQRRMARVTSFASVGLKGKNAAKAKSYCVFS